MRGRSRKEGDSLPYLVLQLSHAWAFWRSQVIAIHDEKLDKLAKGRIHLVQVISDMGELEELEDAYSGRRPVGKGSWI